jgi:hypothetical protein
MGSKPLRHLSRRVLCVACERYQHRENCRLAPSQRLHDEAVKRGLVATAAVASNGWTLISWNKTLIHAADSRHANDSTAGEL